MLTHVAPLLLVGVLLYVAAFGVVVELVVSAHRSRRRDPEGAPFRPRAPWRWWVRGGVLTPAGLGLLAAVDAFVVEPYWPETTHTEVPCAKLPANLARPLRIVHLTDLHSESPARLEPRLPELVAALAPDVIAFTGDALNDRAGLVHFRGVMTHLAALAPTFAVRGNWDVGYWKDEALFTGTGAQELDGVGVTLEVRGVRLHVAGAAVATESGIERALTGAPADAVFVFLHHYPELAAATAGRGPDLALAGDTHGGQVRLPLVGPLLEMKRRGTYYDQGLHRVGALSLYVNRGIGMEGGTAPRVRFLCRPEIAILDLVPAR